MVPDRTSWRSLAPGVVTIMVIIVATIAMLLFARVGALRGETVRIYAATDQARGLMKGSDVWLAGQKVGQVAEIRFLPVSVPAAQRLLLELDLLEQYLAQLRRDSYAQIRTGGSLIGAQVVYLTVGTVAAGPIQAGDTVRAEPQADTEGVASEVAEASRQFPAIVNNIKLLGAQLASARGTLGAFGAEDGVDRLGDVGSRAVALGGRAVRGQGTLPLILRNGSSHVARSRQALARADSIRRLLASRESSLGRLRRDTTLMREIEAVRNEVSIVRAMLAEPRGTAGRVLADSAIVDQLAGLERELGALLRDFKRDPLRFLGFD
jgi:phospholipid/cholesterol/gamma-HCH transport system substrate-binding protein